MKLGLVVIPGVPQLAPSDIDDRLRRGRARFVVADGADAAKFEGLSDGVERIAVGRAPAGWRAYAALAAASAQFRAGRADRAERPDAALFHLRHDGAAEARRCTRHASVADRPSLDDVRPRPEGRTTCISIFPRPAGPSTPGRASSRRGTPAPASSRWPGASSRARRSTHLVAHEVTTFCAPPTVWRMLIQETLVEWKVALREINSAGEPLNPEVIDRVRRAWGLTLRDSYGQTETTMMVGNAPGRTDRRRLDGPAAAGLSHRASGCGRARSRRRRDRFAARSASARSDARLSERRWRGAFPSPGASIAPATSRARDAEGFITYVGRADDVFKSSDYRISPFELESALIEHDCVAEAAVVPAPDPMRYTVPKAYIALAPGVAADRATAEAIFAFIRRAPVAVQARAAHRVRLPCRRPLSGKIRRVELRRRETNLSASNERPPGEWRIEDFPET